MSSVAPAAAGSTPDPIALVTGGHSGIGYYASIHLALDGFHVLIASRSAAKVADAIGQAEKDHPELAGQGKLTHVQLDLTDLQSVRACAAEVEQTYGRLDVLGAYTLSSEAQEQTEPAGTRGVHELCGLTSRLSRSCPNPTAAAVNNACLHGGGTPYVILPNGIEQMICTNFVGPALLTQLLLPLLDKTAKQGGDVRILNVSPAPSLFFVCRSGRAD